MSEHGTFVTSINCMDGRVQLPIIAWLKNKFGADYVDVITEPGPNKILAENKDKAILDSIKRRIDVSVNKHHSKVIAVSGHADCAGNPVDSETQLGQIKISAQNVKTWYSGCGVIGLWVDDNWQVREIK
jgi:hypothetical protein